MLLDNTERLYLERQVTLARAVIAALSLVALLETSRTPVRARFRRVLGSLSGDRGGRRVGGAIPQRSSDSGFRWRSTSWCSRCSFTLRLRSQRSGFSSSSRSSLWRRGETSEPCWRWLRVATVGIIVRVAAEESFRLAGLVALDRHRAGNAGFGPGHGISRGARARASGATAVPRKDRQHAAIRARPDGVDSEGAGRTRRRISVRPGEPRDSRRRPRAHFRLEGETNRDAAVAARDARAEPI